MTVLTDELRLRLEAAGNEPLRLIDPMSHREYVVIRADLYDRLKGLLYDDSPWTDEELDALAAEQAELLGWEGMEDYQDKTS